tara:strand:+ start:2435 stop:3007 length:573 start_codon:yes stop_codon:yes gene_type:complete
MNNKLIVIAVLLVVGCKLSKDNQANDFVGMPYVTKSPKIVSQQGTDRPSASIHRSARQGEVNFIIQHIKAGTDINEINKSDGRIALHSAATHNHAEIVIILINNGSIINLKDQIGMTPLHLAVLGGHVDIVKILIKSKAEVNTINANGSTPLDTISHEFKFDTQNIKSKKKEIEKLLRKNGAKKAEELKL